MKKIIITLILAIAALPLLGQTYSGILTHTSSYFTIMPFSATYDDGSRARIFYDGNNKRLKFWNSSPSVWTDVEAGNIFTNGAMVVHRAGDGVELLKFDDERAWVFKQQGTGPQTALVLQDLAGGKYFKINAVDNTTSFYFSPTDGKSYFRGNMLIGKTGQVNSTYKLDVEGKIRSNEIVVNSDGADYVFKADYQLPKLESVEQYIQKNKHLPEIPSASEMQKEGMSVGELNTRLLQKVEELTLYLIQQQKEIQELKDEVNQLKDK